jgi:hypothetical protein
VQKTIRSTAVIFVATILSAVSAPRAAPASAAQRGAPPQNSPSTIDAGEACSLLTMQDASAALGEPVKGPKSTAGGSLGGTTACEFVGSGLHEVHLNVMHLTPDMASMYKALCAQKGKEGLSGLGDVTCWYNAKHEELQVLKGTTFFSIQLRKSGDPTDAIKGVAKKVYDRLK